MYNKTSIFDYRSLKTNQGGQGKIPGKRKFFQVRDFCGWLGKFRESGNLKINGYGMKSSENLFILFKKGKDVL